MKEKQTRIQSIWFIGTLLLLTLTGCGRQRPRQNFTERQAQALGMTESVRQPSSASTPRNQEYPYAHLSDEAIEELYQEKDAQCNADRETAKQNSEAARNRGNDGDHKGASRMYADSVGMIFSEACHEAKALAQEKSRRREARNPRKNQWATTGFKRPDQ